MKKLTFFLSTLAIFFLIGTSTLKAFTVDKLPSNNIGDEVKIKLFAFPPANEKANALKVDVEVKGALVKDFVPSQNDTWLTLTNDCENSKSFTDTLLCFSVVKKYDFLAGEEIGEITLQINSNEVILIKKDNNAYSNGTSILKDNESLILNISIVSSPVSAPQSSSATDFSLFIILIPFVVIISLLSYFGYGIYKKRTIERGGLISSKVKVVALFSTFAFIGLGILGTSLLTLSNQAPSDSLAGVRTQICKNGEEICDGTGQKFRCREDGTGYLPADACCNGFTQVPGTSTCKPNISTQPVQPTNPPINPTNPSNPQTCYRCNPGGWCESYQSNSQCSTSCSLCPSNVQQPTNQTPGSPGNPIITNLLPVGNVDTANGTTGSIVGWGYDPSDPLMDTNIEIYRGGAFNTSSAVLVTSFKTNVLRQDVLNTLKVSYPNITGNKGFDINLNNYANIPAGTNSIFIYVADLTNPALKFQLTSIQFTKGGTLSACGNYDIDNNGIFNLLDFASFAKVYNTACSNDFTKNTCGSRDRNNNGIIDLPDFAYFAQRYNKSSCL